MFEVWLRADSRDGNDPIEGVATLAIVPRKGDTIAVWNGRGGFMNPGRKMTGTDVYLEVLSVILHADGAGTIEVWVSLDTYDLDELREAFDALRRGDRPGEQWVAPESTPKPQRG